MTVPPLLFMVRPPVPDNAALIVPEATVYPEDDEMDPPVIVPLVSVTPPLIICCVADERLSVPPLMVREFALDPNVPEELTVSVPPVIDVLPV